MNLKTFICTIYCLIVISSPVFAQHIKLDDLSKIELFSSGPWWSAGNSMKLVEVIPEGKGWNSYHLRSQLWPKLIRDSTRRLIKTIPTKGLKQLLAYINKPDTALKLEQFNVSPPKLKQYIDTLQRDTKENLYRHDKKDSLLVNLTAEQKAYFFKIIDSKQAVREATLKAFHLILNDDRSYYRIIFTYKDKHRDSIYAYVASFHLYHLPWQIKNKKSYNPHLTELFESMLDNEGYDKKQEDLLIYCINDELYRRWVLPEIVWADYKLHYPLIYQSLSPTLSPYFSYIGLLKSSLLPANVYLRSDFFDTLRTSDLNTGERLLLDKYKSRHFLFEYIKTHPNEYVLASKVVNYEKVIGQIKAVYPDIVKCDYKQMLLLNIRGNFYNTSDVSLSRSSLWFLLPDGKAILTRFSDNLINKREKIFAGFKHTSYGRNVCIVYDKDGKRIAGDESRIYIDLN